MERSTLETWTPLLTTEERSFLASRSSNVTYDPRSTIVRQDDPPEFVLYIFSGYVQAVSAKTGLIAGIRGPGDIVGEIGSVRRKPRSTNVVSMTQVEGMLVPSHVWIDFIASHPRALGAHYLALSEKFVDDEAVLGQPAKGREEQVAHAILKLLNTDMGEVHEEGIVFKGITQAELGNMVNLSRETVSTVINLLKKRGIVSTSRSRFTVLLPDEIERLAQPQSGALLPEGGESHVGP